MPAGRGKLVNRVLNPQGAESLTEEMSSLPKISVREASSLDAENIAYGVFSPLEGFLGREELECVLYHMRLTDDTPWTIPILLDVSEEEIEGIKEGDDVLLVGPNQDSLSLLHLEEIYQYDKKEVARAVFQTTDLSHPGVASLMRWKDILLGGRLDLVRKGKSPYDRFNLHPAETRLLFREKGWRTIVGFQTRNPPHLGHEWIQKIALTFADGVFVNPLIGRKKKGDFRDDVILKAYDALMRKYFVRERAVLSILRTEMKYAGPREAVHHAIMRKNFGCTHFVVGRDHAGVASFYEPYAAQDMFEEFPDLGIAPIFFSSYFYCRKCGGIANEKTCPHDEEDHMDFSGTKIRMLIKEGKRPPKEVMRPEITDILLDSENPYVE